MLPRFLPLLGVLLVGALAVSVTPGSPPPSAAPNTCAQQFQSILEEQCNFQRDLRAPCAAVASALNTKSPGWIKAHGILMLMAWLCCLFTGISAARHLRNWMPEKVLLGVKMWFNIHRGCNILGLVLMFIALTVVLVGNGGTWRGIGRPMTPGNAHACIGQLAVFCALLQPLNAYIRMLPGGTMRLMFLILHRFFGYLAVVCAELAIGFAIINFGDYIASPTTAFSVWVVHMSAMVFLFFLDNFVTSNRALIDRLLSGNQDSNDGRAEKLEGTDSVVELEHGERSHHSAKERTNEPPSDRLPSDRLLSSHYLPGVMSAKDGAAVQSHHFFNHMILCAKLVCSIFTFFMLAILILAR
ncbi:unnamed protein product, partial [Mesorhabditis spiculigera]